MDKDKPVTQILAGETEYVVPYSTKFARKGALIGLCVAGVGLSILAAEIAPRWSSPTPYNVWSHLYYLRLVVYFAVCGVFVSFMMLWRILGYKPPIVTLKPEGMEIHTQYLDIDLLAWGDIETIQKFKYSSWQVGIVPRDMNSVIRQLRLRQQKTMVTLVRFAARLKAQGRFFAPINIPELYMPITADELIEHIRDFQLRYYPAGPLAGDDPAADPAAWPPKPGMGRV